MASAWTAGTGHGQGGLCTVTFCMSVVVFPESGGFILFYALVTLWLWSTWNCLEDCSETSVGAAQSGQSHCAYTEVYHVTLLLWELQLASKCNLVGWLWPLKPCMAQDFDRLPSLSWICQPSKNILLSCPSPCSFWKLRWNRITY